jgi:hypothetical protein
MRADKIRAISGKRESGGQWPPAEEEYEDEQP